MADLKVAKWGNSLAVRLPAELVRELGLSAGDAVDVPLSLVRKARRKLSQEEAAEIIKRLSVKLPADFKFDREEANAR